jgi:sugar lactone lactonase YvrE
MAFNQVVQFQQGYKKSSGNIHVAIDSISQIYAGILRLNLVGSIAVTGVCVDNSGNMYLTDAINNVIIKITESGKISRIAGTGVAGGNTDQTVACIDNSGNYVAQFSYPTGLTCDKNGDLYIVDSGNNQIRKISNNKVSLVAGSPTYAAGSADGVGNAATFNRPQGIDIDYSGILYVADTENHSIRKIVGGNVMTLAGLSGTPGNRPIWADMTDQYGMAGNNSRFRRPHGIAVNTNGYIFVSDTENHCIKRIDRDGRVRIFSGDSIYGTTIGSAKNSRYQEPKFSDFDRSNALYLVDFAEGGSSRIVRVNEDGASSNIVKFDDDLPAEGKYLAGIAVTPASKIIIVESVTTLYEYSSSSSSYFEIWSTSSISSNSSSSHSLSSSSSTSYVENWSGSSSSYIENWSTSSSSESE